MCTRGPYPQMFWKSLVEEAKGTTEVSQGSCGRKTQRELWQSAHQAQHISKALRRGKWNCWEGLEGT